MIKIDLKRFEELEAKEKALELCHKELEVKDAHCRKLELGKSYYKKLYFGNKKYISIK